MRIAASSLTLANAAEVSAAGLACLRAGDAEFDFSGVERVDSAALALILDWLRTAQARELDLTLKGLPPSLLELAELYGLAELIAPHHHHA
ncbi:MAG: STAS domain-containing protein [Burkholderiaceae bacterium]